MAELCWCGKPASYYLSASYCHARCRDCHQKYMRKYMAKRYSTPEGKEKQATAQRKYNLKRKLELTNG